MKVVLIVQTHGTNAEVFGHLRECWSAVPPRRPQVPW